MWAPPVCEQRRRASAGPALSYHDVVLPHHSANSPCSVHICALGSSRCCHTGTACATTRPQVLSPGCTSGEWTHSKVGPILHPSPC